MSNYRRLISYIYEYEGKTKGRNVGFTKLEARGGQCKISVNVKKIFTNGDAGIYLLSSTGEILLGKLFLRGGTGEFRTAVQVENVEGSGCEMDRCYGLAIHEPEDNWRTYRTIWEDEVAHAAEIELARAVPKEENNIMETAGKVVSEIERELAREEGAPDIVEEKKNIGELQAEAVSEETETQSTPLPETSVEIEEEEDEKVYLVDGTGSEPVRQETVQSTSAPPNIQTVPTQESGWSGIGIMPQDAVQQPVSQAATGLPPAAARPNPLPQAGMPGELEQIPLTDEPAESPAQIWDCFEKAYPKIQAFDSEHGCIILAIKPQDIGLLPREVWIHGNNSFLLHGYYNYRYLILARLENPPGNPRFLLGVPGHYYSNEKYMATMFGFPHFVLSKKQPSGDGRFGYWYTDIQLGNTWEQETSAGQGQSTTIIS